MDDKHRNYLLLLADTLRDAPREETHCIRMTDALAKNIEYTLREICPPIKKLNM